MRAMREPSRSSRWTADERGDREHDERVERELDAIRRRDEQRVAHVELEQRAPPAPPARRAAGKRTEGARRDATEASAWRPPAALARGLHGAQRGEARRDVGHLGRHGRRRELRERGRQRPARSSAACRSTA